MSHAPFDSAFAHSVIHAKYMKQHGETHWFQTADRAVDFPITALEQRTGLDLSASREQLRRLTRDRWFVPGGRYLANCGRDFHQTQNCLLLSCEDTREGWAHTGWKAKMALMTGAGIGIYWGKLRPSGSRVKRTGGVASGPVPEMIATNENGRSAVQGGDRRAAIWAGLPWDHPDCETQFITAKDWPDYIKEAKRKNALGEGPDVPAPLDMTNISVCLDDEFFAAYDDNTHPKHELAHAVYWKTVDQMTQTGEPGFSIDIGEQSDEKLRNACTEIVSADDSDICNLGGLVLPRFESVQGFEDAVRVGVQYLTAGTVYSLVPYTAEQSPDGQGVDAVREKNRRLGLDLIGVHEFLLRKGVGYGTDEAFEVLEPYMKVYDRALEFAVDFQDECKLSHSVAATSGAPAGTRSIGAETTSSHQAIEAAAYRRDVITSKAYETDARETHYVIAPTIAKLLREGVISEHDTIEDQVSLSEDYERILRQQAYGQRHTDQAISMTINLPHVMRDPGERRQFGETLYKYLPQLRGITVYPDGAIEGQPITPVPLSEAVAANNVVVEEDEDKCAGGSCGL